MSVVAVKTEEQQAHGMLFRTRDLLVRQRTQMINPLQGHLAEFGVVAPQGPAHVSQLASELEDPGSGLPECWRRHLKCAYSLKFAGRHLLNVELGTWGFHGRKGLPAMVAGLARSKDLPLSSTISSFSE